MYRFVLHTDLQRLTRTRTSGSSASNHSSYPQNGRVHALHVVRRAGFNNVHWGQLHWGGAVRTVRAVPVPRPPLPCSPSVPKCCSLPWSPPGPSSTILNPMPCTKPPMVRASSDHPCSPFSSHFPSSFSPPPRRPPPCSRGWHPSCSCSSDVSTSSGPSPGPPFEAGGEALTSFTS